METKLTLDISATIRSFLSYLWGMETRIPIILVQNFFKLFILPMRNGNEYTNNPWILKVTAFLSYLWGMETIVSQLAIFSPLAFYPTYEEWKLDILA